SRDDVVALLVSGANTFAGLRFDGLFRSTDDGNSWVPVSTINITELAVKGTDIIAGTSGGFICFPNNSDTWGAIVAGNDVTALAASGTSIFVGTSSGIVRSDDNGTSWAAVNTGLARTRALSLAVFGTTGVFAGTVHGVFRSTDNGDTWTASGPPLSEVN